MEVDTRTCENSERDKVMDLLDIQLPLPSNPPREAKESEPITKLSIQEDLVVIDLSENNWQKPYLDFLLHEIFPEDTKVHLNLKRELC